MSFVKFCCAICVFLNSENLICRSKDISKCFGGSLQLRDNESRLYIILHDYLSLKTYLYAKKMTALILNCYLHTVM